MNNFVGKIVKDFLNNFVYTLWTIYGQFSEQFVVIFVNDFLDNFVDTLCYTIGQLFGRDITIWFPSSMIMCSTAYRSIINIAVLEKEANNRPALIKK